MEKSIAIESIKDRILAEYRKHQADDWPYIAAIKIYSTHFSDNTTDSALKYSLALDNQQIEEICITYRHDFG